MKFTALLKYLTLVVHKFNKGIIVSEFQSDTFEVCTQNYLPNTFHAITNFSSKNSRNLIDIV